MTKYKLVIIDDNKEKLDQLQNEFELDEFITFETYPLLIDSADWTEHKIINEISNIGADGVIADYLLTSTSNGINFNGDKLIRSISFEYRELPIIMISEEPQKARGTEINQFLFIERSELAKDSVVFLEKIYKTIKASKKNIEKIENELIAILNKKSLTHEDILMAQKLDDYLEDTVSYSSKMPKMYKDYNTLKNLTDKLSELDSILLRLGENDV